jgi:antitoxin VapB
MKSESIYKTSHGRPAGRRKTAARPASPALGPAPADRSWDSWFAGESVTADFLNDRDQPVDRAGGRSCR